MAGGAGRAGQSAEFEVRGPISVSVPLRIRGTAIRAGLSRNWRLYLAEELRKAAETLTGKPIYMEHVSADRAVGKVLRAWWDDEEKAVKFEAEIYDPDVAEKIRKGIISHVSIAADYELLEPFDGEVPHGLRFRELSLVAVPGVPGADIEVVEKLLEKLEEGFELRAKRIAESYEAQEGQEAPEERYTPDEVRRLEEERSERSRKYGIEVRPDGHLTPPRRFYEEGARTEEDYADPVNWRYPIHRPENVRAALAYWARFRTYYKRQESRNAIFERIVRAAIKFGLKLDWSKWEDLPEARALPEELKAAFEGYPAAPPAKEVEEGKGGGSLEEKVSVLPEPGGQDKYERIAKVLREALKSSDAAAAIPAVWTPEIVRRPAGLVANLGDAVRTYPQVRGQPGDKVKVPRLDSVEFVELAEGTAPSEPGLTLDSVEITLKEYGQLISITYSVLEDIRPDVVAAIEEMFTEAAKLKEDEVILSKLEAVSEPAAVLYAGGKASEADLTASDVFTPDLVAKAIGAVMSKGYPVKRGDLTLVVHPKQFQDLLQNAQFTNAAMWGGPEVVREGRLREFLGVNIVVSTKVPTGTSSDGTTTYHAFVFHRDAVALAYKRELTLEQERDIASRIMKIMATHRFGAEVILPSAVVKVITA